MKAEGCCGTEKKDEPKVAQDESESLYWILFN